MTVLDVIELAVKGTVVALTVYFTILLACAVVGEALDALRGDTEPDPLEAEFAARARTAPLASGVHRAEGERPPMSLTERVMRRDGVTADAAAERTGGQ